MLLRWMVFDHTLAFPRTLKVAYCHAELAVHAALTQLTRVLARRTQQALWSLGKDAMWMTFCRASKRLSSILKLRKFWYLTVMAMITAGLSAQISTGSIRSPIKPTSDYVFDRVNRLVSPLRVRAPDCN
jgi:hypothetical protein